MAGIPATPETATLFRQRDAVITGIRILVSPVATALLVALLVVTWFYPLDRRRYERVRRLLARRQRRDALRRSPPSVVGRVS